MLFAIVSALLVCASAQQSINLSNVPWTLSNGNNVTIPGKLPSQAHLDLMTAGIIGDPLYGYNDIDQLWVQRSNWTWKTTNISGVEMTKRARTWLIFEGLDTFVEIKLCNHTVANVANQFRKFSFEVTDILPHCSGREPSLSLNFGSASKIVLEMAKTGPGKVSILNPFVQIIYLIHSTRLHQLCEQRQGQRI